MHMKERWTRCLVSLTVISIWIQTTDGHGRLTDPPARSTMFRYGFDNPPNYEDNELFCGGRDFQIGHGGKCGVCGDGWGKVQQNVNGGKFGRGIITKSYEVGELIDVTVDVTAQHYGWFEFSLCPLNQSQREDKLPETELCFKKYVLRDANGQDRYDIDRNDRARKYYLKLQLPEALTCEQCVLRWRWRTGNHNGCEYEATNSDCGLGKGDQEWFYGCADISIGSTDTSSEEGYGSVPSSTPPPTTTTTTTTDSRPTPTTLESNDHILRRWREDKTLPIICEPSEQQRSVPGMYKWCVDNCLHPTPNCPISYCRCSIAEDSRMTTSVDMDDTTSSFLPDESTVCKFTYNPRASAELDPSAELDALCQTNFDYTGNVPFGICSCLGGHSACQRFVATGEHEGKDNVDDFCQFQCVNGSHRNCPEFCKCDDSHQSGTACQASGDMEYIVGYADFCNAVCTLAYCPRNCICTFGLK